jgi:hypothetical protein
VTSVKPLDTRADNPDHPVKLERVQRAENPPTDDDGPRHSWCIALLTFDFDLM